MELRKKLLLMPLSVLTFSAVFLHSSNALALISPRTETNTVIEDPDVECTDVETTDMKMSATLDGFVSKKTAAEKPKFAKFCWGKSCYGGREKGKDPTCKDGGECDNAQKCVAWMTEVPGPTPKDPKVPQWNCGCGQNGTTPPGTKPIPKIDTIQS